MNIDNTKIGFIGFGNMASSICDGLLLKHAVSQENIYACARSWEKLLDNTDARGINACMTAEEVAVNSDLVIVAVPPEQVEPTLSKALAPLEDKAIISIAAGCGYDMLESFLPAGYNHLSTIPNTPVSIGEGIIVCESEHSLTDEQVEMFEGIFSRIAVLEFVRPELLSIGGTISGCTPAFASVMIEALGDAGVKYGLKRDSAYRMAAQMLVGTGKLELATSEHPGAMKDSVCSPGGTTIVGVTALEKHGFRASLIEAIDEIMDV